MSRRDSPTYAAWCAMKRRCYNRNHDAYRYYGARGVTVCERWRVSFDFFLQDVGEKPAGKTLDRFPNADGNYEPEDGRVEVFAAVEGRKAPSIDEGVVICWLCSA